MYVATRAVVAGDELLVDYGRDYFKLASKTSPPTALYECNMLQLNIASARGDLPRVRELLAHGDDVDQVSATASDDDGWTALMEAAAMGHANMALFLLGRGADVNRADVSKGRTALMLASLQDRAAVVRTLLSTEEANPNLATYAGDTPLFGAARRGNVATVRELLESVHVDADRYVCAVHGSHC